MSDIQVGEGGYEKLNDAIEAGSFESRAMNSKSELVNYYKQTHGKSWQKNLSEAIVPFTDQKGKNPAHNVARRFNPDRINRQASKEAQAQYEALGKTLPEQEFPKNITGKKARVSFNGQVCIPSGKKKTIDCRDRKFTQELSAKQTNEMKHGNFNPIFDAWGLNPDIISSIDVDSMSVDFL
jgi:hypothetical protein